jgi:predicted HTH transcriptional regulator
MNMSEPPKQFWTETDVQALLGQSESIRREFKAGVMFDRDPESKWIKDLSAEVSAFANTEGGELFLGIDEIRKSRPRVGHGNRWCADSGRSRAASTTD